MSSKMSPPKKKMKLSAEKEAEKELYRLKFLFINNSALPNKTTENKHLRGLIDHCIEKAHLLKNYKHMGKDRLAATWVESFEELLEKVSALVASVRNWQERIIVSLFYLVCYFRRRTHQR